MLRSRGAANGETAPGSTRAADRYQFDETDRKILEILKANGRATNQKIARLLKISAATVSARIRQMEEAKAMKIVAATDFAAFGYNILLAIGVEVQGRSAEAVAEDLALLPQIVSINLVTGAKDIEILVVAHEFAELSDFLLNRVAAIKGVRNLSPAIAVDVVKFDFDVAPL
jgi:Lrp/AsnC family transcriptional regulator for asnA, asnC and gidA